MEEGVERRRGRGGTSRQLRGMANGLIHLGGGGGGDRSVLNKEQDMSWSPPLLENRNLGADLQVPALEERFPGVCLYSARTPEDGISTSGWASSPQPLSSS